MLLRVYIAELQKLGDEHGFNLEVETTDYRLYRIPARKPEAANKMVLRGREHMPRFMSSLDSEERRGDKVIRI